MATDTVNTAARQVHVPTELSSPAGRAHAGAREDDTVAWQTFLDELDHFIHQHGHAAVPQKATGRDQDGKPYALGRRVNTLRSQYRAGTLAPERIAELEQRPGWAWDARAAAWQLKNEQLRQHLTPDGILTGLPPALEEWLRRQRLAHQEGSLPPSQAQQLASLPGALTDRRSRLQLFLEAAQIWLAANPDRTIADLTTKDHVQVAGNPPIPLLKRATYYRRRHAGLERAESLTSAEATSLEQLRGWTWDGPRATYRTP